MQHNTTVEARQRKLGGRARSAGASEARAEPASEKRRQLIAALLEDARHGSKPYVKGYDVERGAE